MADRDEGSGARVVVGLNDPATMPRLLALALSLAREVAGTVRGFCVVGARSGADNAFANRLLALASQHCADQGALPEPLLIEARSLQQGVLEAVARTEPTHLVLGYSPHREEDLEGERALTRALQQVARGFAGHLVIGHFGEIGGQRNV
jgi:hypothetical protein